MIGYRLTVNCDTNGYLTWSLSFDSLTAKYGDTDTDRIFSVAREFVTALDNLQPQNNSNYVKTLRAVLNEMRYHFDTTNGLIVADGAAPEETWPIDNSVLLERISEADGILDELEHTRSPDCP